MKNTQIAVVAIIVLALGGFGAYGYINQSNSSATSNESINPETQVMDESAGNGDELEPEVKDVAESSDIDMSEISGGSYTPFSPDILADTKDTRRVLFFYANWCSTCKPADASFSQNVSKIPSDVTLIRVNYNDTDTDQAEKDLAKQYSVTYQHTFVQIDSQGNEVATWNGGQIEELLANLK